MEKDEWMIALANATARAECAEARLAIQDRTNVELWPLLARAERAEAKLAERDTPCVWQKDFDNWYQLGCGKHEVFVKDGEYCPKCGHRIEVTT